MKLLNYTMTMQTRLKENSDRQLDRQTDRQTETDRQTDIDR